QRNRVRTARFVQSKEPAQNGLDAENLEEISNHLDTSGGLRLTTPGKAQVVRRGEGFISGHILIDAALFPELFVCIRRICGARKPAVARRWCNPHKQMRIGKRQ